MRSDLVYAAGLQVDNRFLLATIVMRAVQTLHINARRTEDTANRVFSDVANGCYIRVDHPAIAPITTIEPLLVSPAA